MKGDGADENSGTPEHGGARQQEKVRNGKGITRSQRRAIERR